MTDFSYYTRYRTSFILLLYIPVLTMRSLAEERRSRTDQLLLTSPEMCIRDSFRTKRCVRPEHPLL